MMKATLYTDGGARGNPGPAGMGFLLFDDKGILLTFGAEFSQHMTNNQAEYSALYFGLKLAQKNGISDLTCNLDSELVVKQLKGEYKIKDQSLLQLKNKVDDLAKTFGSISFTHVPRELNKHADRLVNLIMDAHLQ